MCAGCEFSHEPPRRIKQPLAKVAPIRNIADNFAKRDIEKSELFARHISHVFQPHDIQTNIKPTPIYQASRSINFVQP